MTLGLVIEWVVKSLIIILGMTLGFAYVTLFERKVLARMQVRIGPNRAGPGGILAANCGCPQVDLERRDNSSQRG